MRKAMTANSLYRPSSEPKMETMVMGVNWKIRKARMEMISEITKAMSRAFLTRVKFLAP